LDFTIGGLAFPQTHAQESGLSVDISFCSRLIDRLIHFTKYTSKINELTIRMPEMHGLDALFMKKVLQLQKHYGNHNAVWNY
jgi:hypothetical protein